MPNDKHTICPILDNGNFVIHCNNGYPRNVAPGYAGELAPCALWNAGQCALAAPAPAAAAPAKQGFWKWLSRAP